MSDNNATNCDNKLSGSWSGSLDLGAGISLPLVLRFKEAADGQWSGSMESPAQGSMAYTFDRVATLSGERSETIEAESAALRASFAGKLEADGSLSGLWTQGGAAYPLVLSLTPQFKPPHRPQEPLKPYPYQEETISFASGNVALAGTLTRPTGNSPVPAVILLCGSGPNDRNEQVFFHRPFLVLADYLTRRGMAVLRYDKRGVGASGGSYSAATSMDFADDALAALNWLKAQEGIDAGKIGLIGHSEGGLVAPIVASRSSDVAFIVSLAGSALPGEEILLLQSRAIAEAQGVDEKTLTENHRRSSKIYEIVKTELDNAKAKEKIVAVLKPQSENQYGQADQAALEAQLEALTGAWYRFFISFDPRDAWSKAQCPVLAINGDKDLQVLAGDNLQSIRMALAAGGNMAVTTELVNGVNHLFQSCDCGLPSQYALIEETFSPVVLALIGAWLSAVLES